jgi:ATP-dependent DNA helicase RecG
VQDEVDTALRQLRRGVRARKLESHTLDFKAPSRSPKDTFANLTEAAVCFANAAGGTIVLGVADDTAGSAAFVGTELTAAAVRRAIYERTSPGLDVTVVEHVVQDHTVLVITVPEGLEVYGTARGQYSWRRETDCSPMTADDVGRLREERASEDWSARSAGGGGPDQVDPAALARARALLLLVPERGVASLADATSRDLLGGLGLLTPRGSLTNAGWLMFGPRGERELPRIIYQHRHAAGGEPDRVVRMSEPLLLAVDRLFELVEARLSYSPVNLWGGQQLAVADYPPVATREALLNAVVHGDHRTGRPVQVEHSPDWLTVVSPGPLVAGVTPHNILRHPHRARFRSLFNAFRHLGLVEQVGQGIDRMYREMLRFGRTPPRIADDRDQVSVTFTADRPNIRIARFVARLPSNEQDDLDVLLILNALRKRRSVTARDMASEIQRPVDETQALLRRLADDDHGLLEPSQGTIGRRLPNYRLRGAVLADLGPAVAYHRAPSSERERKIVEHISEYGSINNRTVQNMFDVDVYRASAILRDLVVREVLVRTSEQTRGQTVRYGPGPAYTAPSRR